MGARRRPRTFKLGAYRLRDEQMLPATLDPIEVDNKRLKAQLAERDKSESKPIFAFADGGPESSVEIPRQRRPSEKAASTVAGAAALVA
jgi:hypothetical protein